MKPEVNDYECLANYKEGIVSGKYKGKEIWNLRFEDQEKIQDVYFLTEYNTLETSHLVEADRVVYKLADPNNFLVLTRRN